jgi:hypothetical protein
MRGSASCPSAPSYRRWLRLAYRRLGWISHGSPERNRKLADARRHRVAEARAWEAANPVTPNPHVFASEVFPLLNGVPSTAVRAATGLSISYCRRVLSGRYVPHPMHWDALRRLGRAADA